MKYTLKQTLKSGEVLVSTWTMDNLDEVKRIAKAWRKNDPGVKVRIVKIA